MSVDGLKQMKEDLDQREFVSDLVENDEFEATELILEQNKKINSLKKVNGYLQFWLGFLGVPGILFLIGLLLLIVG